jgi:beta-glucosidase
MRGEESMRSRAFSLRRGAPVVLAALGGLVAASLASQLAACAHLHPGAGGDVGGFGPPVTLTFDGGTPVVEGDGGPPVTRSACGDAPYADPWTPGYSVDENVAPVVQAFVDSMSPSELAQQMRGTTTGSAEIFRQTDNTNKGIQAFKFRDGPRGVCLAAELPAGANGYSTAFPVAETRAAAFDMDLEEQIGEAIGDETVASGNTMLLAPVINILRHPAWGRAQETYGEDSFVLGRLGSAFTTGAQKYLPACVKHYAANNVENGRDNDNADMDEQTLREHYARHFGVVTQDSGVSCVMASYNLVNGTKSTLNKHLLTDILRTDFGYQGFVMSDWWAMPPGYALTATTDALQANAREGVNAGLDMELPWAFNYQQLENVASLNQLAHSAGLILTQKYRFKVGKLGGATSGGLLSAKTTLSAQHSIEGNEDHIALARKAALEGTVLVKNENATLPISRTTVHTIAVIGATVPYHVVLTDQANGQIDFAHDLRLGDLGSSRVFADPAKSTGPTAGIQAVAGAGIQVVSGSDANLAANADFAVVVVGLTPQDEGENYTGAGDRTSFALDDKNKTNVQNDLVTAVAAKGKPMVVVIEAGAIIDMPWLAQVPAVVMAWYPGMDGGYAIGQLLFGDVNFSGKLPMTWPKSWNDEPVFNSGASTHDDYFVGYQYFDHNGIAPLYPFGFGLSYTKFDYKNLQVPCSTVTTKGVVYVTTDVTNTGTVAGDEIAFLFVSYPAGIRRPVKELKGFQRVSLAPGETRRVTFPLRVADLRYWDSSKNAWQPTLGDIQIMVGPSAAELPLTDKVTVVQ